MAVLPRYNPENDVVVMELVQSGVQLNAWKEYSVTSSYMEPTDSFSFTIAAEHMTKPQKDALLPGAEIKLMVNDHLQVSGYIDQIAYSATRSDGAELKISGRDKMSLIVDSCIDPTTNFKEAMNLEQFLAAALAPWGYTKDSFTIDDETNLGIVTGNVRGVKMSHSKKRLGAPINSYKLHQIRPYSGEGAFEFCSRISQRLGLWMRPQADGKQITVSKPTYDGTAIYTIRRSYDGHNDILDGEVVLNLESQPSIIVADAFSTNGVFGAGRCWAYMENPIIEVPMGAHSAITNKFRSSSSNRVAFPELATNQLYTVPQARPLYLHDDEAKDQTMLNNYVKREMAHRLKKSLTFNPTVQGHEANGSVWSVNTIVSVDCEVSGLKENLWVMARTFTKSRSRGTLTKLELIRQHSFEV